MLRARVVWVATAALGLAVAGTGCADQSAAIRVGDQTVSESDFLDEVHAVGANDTALQLLVNQNVTSDDVVGELGDDSYTQPFVGFMVQQRVQQMLYEQLAEQEGIEVSDADRGGVRSQLESSGSDITDLPDWFVDQLVDDFALRQALQNAGNQDDGLQAKFLTLIEDTKVEVSSRFGKWDQDAFLASLQGQQSVSGAVIPPPAPQPAGGQGAADPGAADQGSPSG